MIEKGNVGGIDYLKNLGVNAVELLPTQEFANIEIPFKDSLKGKFNSWNPYERNHWGYMTAAYFAPEAYYGEKPDKSKIVCKLGQANFLMRDYIESEKWFKLLKERIYLLSKT